MCIPKVIHLCWFGRGDFPKLAKMCIESWKKYLPDYEIKLWNEDNYDVNKCSYTKKAYKERRWAFVSDYARLDILYNHGGIYMDTDLEIIKDFTDLLEEKRFVSSYIEGGLITAGFIACEKNHPFIKKIIDFYDGESKKIENNQQIDYIMNPLIFTEAAIREYGFSLTDNSFENDVITVYPIDYFMAYKKVTFGTSYAHWRYRITKNTCALHHDMSSWHKRKKLTKLIKSTIRLVLPQNIYISMKIKKNLEEIEKRKMNN
ncbi:MAG: glycosyl transferase [Clostridia bacterium]|nr:glycosyl transferase [Clostridia bacterium]